MDPQFLQFLQPVLGVGSVLGLIVYLSILIANQQKEAKKLSDETMGREISALREQVTGLKEQNTAMGEKLDTLNLLFEKEFHARLHAELDNHRLRAILIRNGLGEEAEPNVPNNPSV